MIYLVLYSVLAKILYFLFPVFSWVSPKLSKMYMGRIVQNDEIKTRLRQLPDKPRIWFHAASAGEYEQIRPILRRMNRSQYILIVSVFSSTIYDQIDDLDEFDLLVYLPFDLKKFARQFVELLHAKIWIISRHDLWFHHIREAKKYGTKIAIVNANLHAKSRRFWFPFATKKILNSIDAVMTMNSHVAVRWEKFCPPPKISIVGDTRFDQILDRKNAFLGFKNFHFSTAVIFGSLLPSDEPLVFESIQKIHQIQPDLKIIIVPHEPDEKTLQRYQKFFVQHQIEFSLWSDTSLKNCVIIDKVGILADLYRYSRVAYIGGGFGAGVHSVIEPAIYKNHICFGENFVILEEAIELVNLKLAQVVNTAKELIDFIFKNINAGNNEDIMRYFMNKVGASQTIVDWVENDGRN